MEWATLGAAAISGLSNIGGGMMSAAGAERANQQNAMLNQQNINYQMDVNNQNRDFQNNVNVANWAFQDNVNKQNFEFAREQTNASQAFAREQMGFQKEMSSTAYQRAVADMRAAGINPMLAYSQGGASSPAGAMGSAPSASGAGQSGGAYSGSAPQSKFAMNNTQEELGRAVGRAASSAVDTYRTGEAARQLSATRELTDAQKVKVGYEQHELDTRAEKEKGEKELLSRQEEHERERIENAKAERSRIRATTAREAAAARSHSADANLQELRHREARPVNEGGHGRGTGIGPGAVDRIIRQAEDLAL